MAESGLLLREKARNQVFYQANSECPIYKVFVKADEMSLQTFLAWILRESDSASKLR